MRDELFHSEADEFGHVLARQFSSLLICRRDGTRFIHVYYSRTVNRSGIGPKRHRTGLDCNGAGTLHDVCFSAPVEYLSGSINWHHLRNIDVVDQ